MHVIIVLIISDIWF